MPHGTDPKADAPRLSPDGALHFESQAAFVRVFDGFLSKGGLPVKPDKPLEPLAAVTVRFGDGAAEVEAQVVMIQQDVTVLRLTEALPPTVAVMVESARNAPPSPSPTANPFATKPTKTAQAPAPTSPATKFVDDRPTLEGTTLFFSDYAHAKALEKSLLSQLSVRATGQASNASQVNLVVGTHRADLAIGCDVVKEGPDVVTIRFEDIGALAGAFRALLTLAEKDKPAAPRVEIAPHQSDEVEKAEIDGALASFLGVPSPPAEDAPKSNNPFATRAEEAHAPPSEPEPIAEPAPPDVKFVDDRPTLQNDTLFFSDHAHAKEHERKILSSLSVEATGAASDLSAVHLAIGPHQADFPLPCSIASNSADVVDVRFSDIGSLAGAFRALLILAEKSAPAQPPPPPSPEVSAKIQSSEEDKAAINDALANFLGGETQVRPTETPPPVEDIFAPAPAAAEVPKDLFDVPKTGSEDELAAIVDAFDVTPADVSDILDIQAPPVQERTDSLEITVFDITEATAEPVSHASNEATAPPVAPPPRDFAGPTPAPCSLVDDTLQFSAASLAEVREGFETLGMIWATVDDAAAIDPHVERKVRVQVGEKMVDAAMRAVAMPGPPGTCLLRILDVSALGAILDASAPASGGDEDEPGQQPQQPTFAKLRGTSLAFDDIEVLKAARQQIEAEGSIGVKCLTTPPARLTLSANVSGASLGTGWPASCAVGGGHATLTFDRPAAVLEAMSLFLAAFDDATTAGAEMAAPTLSGHFLNFAHANLARIAASEIEEHQAILVTPTVAVTPDETRNVRFQVAERPLPDAFEIRLQPAHDGKAIAFFDGDAAKEVAQLLHAAIAAPSHTVGISPTEVAEAVLKKSGRLRNPSSASELLSIPIATAPKPSDVQTPSTPLLLRLLMGKAGTTHVRIRQTASDREVAFDVVDGREIFSAVPIAKLASSLAFQDGTYAIESADKVQPGQKQMLTVSLIGELLRALIRRVTVDALAAGFPHAEETPILTDRGARLLEAIGLSSTQTRLAKLKFNGKESAENLADGLRVPLLGWELFYVLEIMGGIDWTAPEIVTEVRRKDPLEVEWELLQTRDDFDALGLHWSTAPRHIEPAYAQAKERYGPQSNAATRRPDLAKQILGRMTSAYERLKDAKSRREYRKAAFSLNWTQQSDLMLSHAKLATYRGDMSEARDLLEGILDFQSNAEASALLKKLEKANLV